LSAPEPNNPTTALSRGLASTLAGIDFRRLWFGQIFSQLADKFYILLMVFLITHYLVISPPVGDGALAEAAASINMEVQTALHRDSSGEHGAGDGAGHGGRGLG
jgi:hypothetical protein